MKSPGKTKQYMNSLAQHFNIQDIKNFIPHLPGGKLPGEDQIIIYKNQDLHFTPPYREITWRRPNNTEFLSTATDEMLQFVLIAFKLIIEKRYYA